MCAACASLRLVAPVLLLLFLPTVSSIGDSFAPGILTACIVAVLTLLVCIAICCIVPEIAIAFRLLLADYCCRSLRDCPANSGQDVDVDVQAASSNGHLYGASTDGLQSTAPPCELCLQRVQQPCIVINGESSDAFSPTDDDPPPPYEDVQREMFGMHRSPSSS